MYTGNINLIESSFADARPTTYDYLRPNAFRFTIKDMPHVSYTCQSANLPGLNLGFAVQPTPFLDINTVGDKMQFSDFTIRFLISEDMSNYVELYNWLVALGFPKSYTQYSDFTSDRLNRFPYIKDARGGSDVAAYSDATLTILDSVNIPKTNIVFRDLFPVSLEALDFDIASASVEYFVGIASFRYKLFDIEPL